MSPVILVISKKCNTGVFRGSSLVIEPNFKLLF
jgi:hypothetical protein